MRRLLRDRGANAMTSESAPQSTNDPNEVELSRQWKEQGRRYVAAINAYVARGQAEGWKTAGNEPQDPRARLAVAVIAAVRRANEQGKVEAIHDRFPPAYEPLIGLIGENEQCLSVVLLLEDGRIILRVGAPYEEGRLLILEGTKIVNL